MTDQPSVPGGRLASAVTASSYSVHAQFVGARRGDKTLVADTGVHDTSPRRSGVCFMHGAFALRGDHRTIAAWLWLHQVVADIVHDTTRVLVQVSRPYMRTHLLF